MNLNAVTKHEGSAVALSRPELIRVLGNSLYPGAAAESIALALGYCEAAGLDPMQKPVHIVPVWDSKIGAMRDVIMPGVGMYRTSASRTGQFAGMTEPEFGDLVTKQLKTKGGDVVDMEFPEWCRVTVKRQLASGTIAEFTAVERWLENYATDSSKSTAPNAMWRKRPHGQLAKCAQAQALRIAFPELGASPTADEMEGKPLDPGGEIVAEIAEIPAPLMKAARDAAGKGTAAYAEWWKAITKEERQILQFEHDAFKVTAKAADDAKDASQQQPGGAQSLDESAAETPASTAGGEAPAAEAKPAESNADFVAALDAADQSAAKPAKSYADVKGRAK